MTLLAQHPARVAGMLMLSPLEPPPMERLMRSLSFPNPVYVRRIQLGYHPGSEPERVCALIELPDGTLCAPRGAVELVKQVLGRYGELRPVYADERARGEALPLTGDAGLRDYQTEGVDKLERELQGLIVLPCGCGKTRLGIGAIGRIRRTTLVLVPSGDLADQWAAALLECYGVRAGIVGGGKNERGADIVVGIIDSIDELLTADPAWGARFGLVIVDEAHHAPAITYTRVLGKLPARWRLGLTATPDREDGLTRWVEWSFGRILLERNTSEMIRFGYLMAATIEEVNTAFRFDGSDLPEKKRISALERELSEDLVRNAQIADRVAEEARRGETVLVLAGRREQAKELAEMIRARGINAQHVTGKTGKKKRTASISDLRAGTLPVLCATSLADEGVDVARLSRVALAAPQRARGRTLQRLGRLLRLWPGKKPRLLDFVDPLVETLMRRTRDRRRVWKETGLVLLKENEK